MNKENKGKISLDLSGNLQYKFEIDYGHEYDCDSHGCDMICRCGVIVNAKLTPMGVYDAAELAFSFFYEGEGKEGNLGFALSVLFFKNLFSNADDYFEIRTCNGYYGEEIEGVYAEPGTEYKFQKRCEVFNSMSNSERIKEVLKMEYGSLLPEVDKYNEWNLIQVPTEKVHADKDVLNRCSSSIEQSYRRLVPWYALSYSQNFFWKKHSSWFPGIIVIPRTGGGYRVIDGFHRYKAWTTKPCGLNEQKWKKLKTNKKINVIAPKV